MMSLTTMESVLASTCARVEAGGEFREAFAESAAAHRLPHHERRLVELRAELGRLCLDELFVRAAEHGIESEVPPATLVELIARHEAGEEALEHELVDAWLARQRHIFGPEIG